MASDLWLCGKCKQSVPLRATGVAARHKQRGGDWCLGSGAKLKPGESTRPESSSLAKVPIEKWLGLIEVNALVLKNAEPSPPREVHQIMLAVCGLRGDWHKAGGK